MDTIAHWITQYGYAGLFVLLMLGIVGVPVPDETLLTFTPGLRHVTAYAAGMTCMRYWIFAVFAYAGSVVWAATFLVIGYLLGPEWQKAIEYARRGRWVLAGLFAFLIVVAVTVWLLRNTRVRGRTP